MLRGQIDASTTARAAQAQHIASLESMLAKYRSELDNMELALAASECKAEIKSDLKDEPFEFKAELKDEPFECISSGVHESPAPRAVQSVHMHGNDQEKPQSYALSVSHSVDASEDTLSEMEMLRSERDALRAEVEAGKSERLHLQHAVSVAVADAGHVHEQLLDSSQDVRTSCLLGALFSVVARFEYSSQHLNFEFDI